MNKNKTRCIKQTCQRLYPMQFKSHAKVIRLPYLPAVLSWRINTFENAEDIHVDRISLDICKTILGYTTFEKKDQHITWRDTKNEMLDAFLPNENDDKTYMLEYVSRVIIHETSLINPKTSFILSKRWWYDDKHIALMMCLQTGKA